MQLMLAGNDPVDKVEVDEVECLVHTLIAISVDSMFLCNLSAI